MDSGGAIGYGGGYRAGLWIGNLRGRGIVMDKWKLLMLIGLPRSGKSTWARSEGHPVVNPDSIRLALHGQAFSPAAEPLVWAIARYMVHSLFLAGHKYVILDATNTTKARRDVWKGPWDRVPHLMSASEKDCLSRVNTYPKEIQETMRGVITGMAGKFEPIADGEFDAG